MVLPHSKFGGFVTEDNAATGAISSTELKRILESQQILHTGVFDNTICLRTAVRTSHLLRSMKAENSLARCAFLNS